MGYIIATAILALIVIIILRNPNRSKVVDVPYTPTPHIVDYHSKVLLELINNHRSNLMINTLVSEQKCYQLAHQHTEWMSSNQIISHQSALARKQVILQSGFVVYGEIVAGGYNNIQSMFNGYLNSEKHREIVEHSQFKYLGISIITTDKTYNAVVFAG